MTEIYQYRIKNDEEKEDSEAHLEHMLGKPCEHNAYKNYSVLTIVFKFYLKIPRIRKMLQVGN